MIKRSVEKTLKKLVKGYPAIAITGPRQSGKTTLAKMVFNDRPYVSLENPDIRERALEDPKNFLKRYIKEGAVFDEVQRCPELFSYLQQIIDEGPGHCRFILTGSSQFGLRSKISQSLAGRVAMIHLLPFCCQELYNDRSSLPDFDRLLLYGFYPPIYDRNLEPSYWYANYFQTYIERDVHQLINIRDLSVFQKFVRLCAARTGQLVNLSNLSVECGINHNTAKAWISILEASYIVHLLQPYYNNYGKRLVKTPKIYFYDTGLAAYLTGINNLEMMSTHQYRGKLFETFIINEIIKSSFNSGIPYQIYFWRDRGGNEVDVITEKGNNIKPLEIKSGSTFNKDFLKGINSILKIDNIALVEPSLIYGGEDTLSFKEYKILSWKDFIFDNAVET